MLNEYEIELLRKIDRGESIEWGAAVGQALETLRGHGYVTRTHITEAGKRALAEAETPEHDRSAGSCD